MFTMGKGYRNHIFAIYLKKDPKYLTVTYMGLLALLPSQNKVSIVYMCMDTNQSNYSREGCKRVSCEVSIDIPILWVL